jgi:hypothetical protein
MTLVKKYLNDRFYQFGQPLDKYLKPFYKKEFSREKEWYAMVVVDESFQEKNLLSMINNILASPEGKQKIKKLNRKWIQPEKDN